MALCLCSIGSELTLISAEMCQLANLESLNTEAQIKVVLETPINLTKVLLIIL